MAARLVSSQTSGARPRESCQRLESGWVFGENEWVLGPMMTQRGLSRGPSRSVAP